MNHFKCSIRGCTIEAYAEVILYDIYSHDGSVFFKQDFTCPYICRIHLLENEKTMIGRHVPRGTVQYMYTNQYGAQGFTIYRPLVDQESKEILKQLLSGTSTN